MSVSAMDTDIIIDSEANVGKGHWKLVIWNFRIFTREPGISEALSPLYSRKSEMDVRN